MPTFNNKNGIRQKGKQQQQKKKKNFNPRRKQNMTGSAGNRTFASQTYGNGADKMRRPNRGVATRGIWNVDQSDVYSASIRAPQRAKPEAGHRDAIRISGREMLASIGKNVEAHSNHIIEPSETSPYGYFATPFDLVSMYRVSNFARIYTFYAVRHLKYLYITRSSATEPGAFAITFHRDPGPLKQDEFVDDSTLYSKIASSGGVIAPYRCNSETESFRSDRLYYCNRTYESMGPPEDLPDKSAGYRTDYPGLLIVATRDYASQVTLCGDLWVEYTIDFYDSSVLTYDFPSAARPGLSYEKHLDAEEEERLRREGGPRVPAVDAHRAIPGPVLTGTLDTGNRRGGQAPIYYDMCATGLAGTARSRVRAVELHKMVGDTAASIVARNPTDGSYVKLDTTSIGASASNPLMVTIAAGAGTSATQPLTTSLTAGVGTASSNPMFSSLSGGVGSSTQNPIICDINSVETPHVVVDNMVTKEVPGGKGVLLKKA